MDSKTLYIIPCCASKGDGGLPVDKGKHTDPLNFTKLNSFKAILDIRSDVLRHLKSNKFSLVCEACKKEREKNGTFQQCEGCRKNVQISSGPDFGGDEIEGKYFQAICRYQGNLYSTDFVYKIRKRLSEKSPPHILILSALYGPLHPCSMIQNYSLKMGGYCASKWNRNVGCFLSEYVTKNGINGVNLYMSKGPYISVATSAIRQMLNTKGITIKTKDILRCDIRCRKEDTGNKYTETPRCQGLQLLLDLGFPISRDTFTREVQMVRLF